MAGEAKVETKLMIDLSEVRAARRQVKKLRRAADEADRSLARVEARLLGLDERLAEFGIRLEVGGLIAS